MTDTDKLQMEADIMAVVHRIGDPLLEDIIKGIECDSPEAEVRKAVNALVQHGDLRMKEDTVDHDWAYRMTRQGRERFGYKLGA